MKETTSFYHHLCVKHSLSVLVFLASMSTDLKYYNINGTKPTPYQVMFRAYVTMVTSSLINVGLPQSLSLLN